ncbi:MAG: phosphotransferase [Rhodoluna sp.]|nr:phosphotransferase [Rhodoluna sp.]
MEQAIEFAQMTIDQQIDSLGDCLDEILAQYDLGDFEVDSINHEYNSTFKVTSSLGQTHALRINVNSSRTLANLNAEIAWVSSIKSVRVPKPRLTRNGSAIAYGWHEATNRKLPAVLYSWLDGQEPGDEPTEEQLFALGAAMAKLHLESVAFDLPSDAELPDYTDAFWGADDHLCGPNSKLSEAEQAEVTRVFARIEKVIAELQGSSALQPIHADLHPWNVMWHEGELAIFDFDDSGFGLPIQDLMTAIYYLDTPEQDVALLAGYASISPIPEHTPEQRAVLMLQRRLLLLNYLYETSNPEHLEMIPEYQAETMRRLRAHAQQH